MSSPPPPPPRRARPDAGAGSPAGPGTPAPPPRRRAPDQPIAQAPAAAAADRTAPVSRPPSGPTRAERQLQQNGNGGGRRSRRGLVVTLVVLAVLLVGVGAAFALGAFGSDDGGGEEAAPDPSNVVKLEAGTVQVYWPGLGPEGAQAPPELQDQLMTVLREYVDNGMIAGVRTGKVKDADLSNAFDEAALARLKGDDRSVLLDEGMPEAVGKVTVASVDPSVVYVLNDAQGQTQVATIAVNLEESVRSEKGPYTIRRIGQLELTPDASGVWKITGWDLNIERSGAGLPASLQTPTSAPTPTAAGTPTTAAGPTTTAGSE